MAKDGAFAMSEDGRHPPALIAEAAVADCVNTAMNAVKASSGDAAGNTCRGKAGGSELVAGNNAVLIGGNAGDERVRIRFVEFRPHVRT